MCKRISFLFLLLFLAAQPSFSLKEYRAVWLTTNLGLDWPRRPANSAEDVRRQKRSLCEMLDRLQECGINTVLFQSRLRGTTAYASAIEPWDEAFAGKVGKAPAYDPLAFATEECHRRGMEIHAWVVAFPVQRVSTARQLGAKALHRLHPGLCQKCGEQYIMNPGMPETAGYLARICREIAENYDVDGIHLDYIRYPEKGIAFDDEKTFRKYGAGQTKSAWRTANVDRCVQAVHDAIKAVRPWIKISCSPIGKYSDLTRQSSRGWNARDAVSQDAQRWLEKGWMDMLFPMMYFDGDNFYPFLADWREHDAGRPIVPGLGIWFLDKKERDWPLSAIQRQMSVSRLAGLGGACFFRAKHLLDNEKGLYDWLKNHFYAIPATVPPMAGRADTIAPAAPEISLQIEGNTLLLSWKPVADATPITYNVYRTDSASTPFLLARRLRETSYSRLLTLPSLRHTHYAVTAVDAWGNESEIKRRVYSSTR